MGPATRSSACSSPVASPPAVAAATSFGSGRLGSVEGAPGALDVDLAGQLGNARQHRHPVVGDVDEATSHRRPNLATLRLADTAADRRDPDDADVDGSDEVGVVRQEHDLAAVGPQHDELGVAGVQHAAPV